MLTTVEGPNMNTPISSILAISFSVILAACNSGGGDSGEVNTDYTVTGAIQKGPFISGSQVIISELDRNLNPKGNTYIISTINDLGEFSLGSKIKTKIVEINANGYFMDEITGNLSTSTSSLSTIADLSVDQHPTVNILTTLQKSRIIQLIKSGLSYEEAEIQSRKEVLAVFGINTNASNINALYSMDMEGSTDSDAILVAASAIFMQMSNAEAAKNSTSAPAELTNFINTIAADLTADGYLDNSIIKSNLSQASIDINLKQVRTNIENYYANKGVSLVAPLFEEWVDKDSSGILPKRLVPVSSLSLNDEIDAEALHLLTSNTYEVTGLGAGIYAPVEVNGGADITKNGGLINGDFTTVSDGDLIQLRYQSGKFGEQNDIALNIGSSVDNWRVNTKIPLIKYRSVDANFPFPNSFIPGDDPEKYHAFPVLINETFTAKYIGTSFNASDMTPINPLSVSIYSDNNGVPDGVLITSNMIDSYFSNIPLVISSSGLTQEHLELLGFQIYLGDAGLSVNSGDKLWVVFEFESAYDNGSRGNATVGHSARMVSVDGVTWTNYQGQANGRYSNYMPLVLFTE